MSRLPTSIPLALVMGVWSASLSWAQAQNSVKVPAQQRELTNADLSRAKTRANRHARDRRRKNLGASPQFDPDQYAPAAICDVNGIRSGGILQDVTDAGCSRI